MNQIIKEAVMKYYTGVGSRKTPAYIQEIMGALAKKLMQEGWILRSGGAEGADKAFEQFIPYDCKEIYYAKDATPEAEAIAAQFHPAWNRCGDYARSLHGRNAFQVLGRNLKTPSGFLTCWTPDGCLNHASRIRETGGTGTAISIADNYKIQVFNLANKQHLNRILKKLGRDYLL